MEHCGAIQEAWNVAGHCKACQDAQDAWDAQNTLLGSGPNARRSDAGSVFADVKRKDIFENTDILYD